MELVALICRKPETSEAIRGLLQDYTVCTVKDLAELEEALIDYTFDLFVVDTESVEASLINSVLKMFGKEAVVLFKHPGFDMRRLESIPLHVTRDTAPAELHSILQIALAARKATCQRGTALPRNNHRHSAEDVVHPVTHKEALPGGLHRHVLVNFAKVLTANFDIDKILVHFMESLSEISHANKISIMLREGTTFSIKAHKNIDPHIAQHLKLNHKSVLLRQLAQNGGIIQRAADPDDEEKMRLFQEMSRLQCALSFPMMYKGKLEGIVNIGEKITGEPFHSDELEVIYTLCNYQAAAIKDIDLYHQIHRQKEFIRNILANMSSGVITIDKNEKVRIFNPTASEILGVHLDDILGKDLRNLPSPLGDILYETMVDGILYKRHEVPLRLKGIELGINSYRLCDDGGTVVGAGIIFTDISSLKKYEEEKREAEKLKLMHVITAQIAHNIKNPLSAITTFSQLIDTKFNDKEFRSYYKTTVLSSVHRLNTLIDKILFLTGSIEFNPDVHNVNIIIRDAVSAAKKEAPDGVNLTVRETERPVFVNADLSLLSKALYYLISSFSERLRPGKELIIETNLVGNKVPRIEIAVKCPDFQVIDRPADAMPLSGSGVDVLGENLDVAIMQRIAEAHKGGLTIKEVDSGSALFISLPVKEAA
ncbi:MAG: histidine kinase dimerization/phospho-acceptor domain-containing protein [Nitrospirota bacterium]